MYGKIFESIYDGTLVDNWQALITFQQMIILCDSEGIIDMTPSALSRRTGIPIEHIEEGIKHLEKDDEGSRTPDENGKRIVRIDNHRSWGWRIVNHGYYRKLASYEDKKKADRERIATKRQNVASSRIESHRVADVAHTDTDTDTDKKIPYVEIITHLNKAANRNFKPTTPESRRFIKARWNNGFRLDDFKRVIDTKTSQWANDKTMSIYLRPPTLFGTKFESYLNESPCVVSQPIPDDLNPETRYDD